MTKRVVRRRKNSKSRKGRPRARYVQRGGVRFGNFELEDPTPDGHRILEFITPATNKITKADIDALNGHSAELATVTIFRLNGLANFSSFRDDIMHTLTFFPNLWELSLLGVGLTGEDVSALVEKFSSFTHLQRLDLRYNSSMNKQDITELMAGLVHIPTLTQLYLKNVRLGDSGGSELAHVLPSLPNLVVLDLAATDITDFGDKDNGIRDIVAALPVTLTYLDLTGTILSKEAFEVLCNKITMLTALSVLRLATVGIEFPDMKHLAAALPTLLALTKLDLAFNSIEAEGAAELAQALTGLTALQELNLEGNSIGNVGAQKLINIPLSNLVALRSLKLSGNGITQPFRPRIRAALPPGCVLSLYI